MQQGAAQGGRLLVVRFPTAPVPDAKAPPLVGFVQPIAHATHWTPGKAGSQTTFKIGVLSIFVVPPPIGGTINTPYLEP